MPNRPMPIKTGKAETPLKQSSVSTQKKSSKQLPKYIKCPACGEVQPEAMCQTLIILDGAETRICDACAWQLNRLDE